MSKNSKYMSAKLLMLLSLLLCTSVSWAQEIIEPQERNTVFFRANNSYKEDKYDAAIQDYEQLINSGLRSANIYYNLGNAYLRTGNKGKAILNYERAFRLYPRDADIRANLGFARNLVEGGAQQIGKNWLKQIFFFFQGFLSANELTSLVSVLYFVIMVLLILSIYFRLQRKIFYYAGAIFCLFLIMVLPSFIGSIHESEFQTKAVVMVEETPVRFEPNGDATIHFTLYEGSVIQITRSQSDWHQVRRGDGKMGWLKSEVFNII